MTDLKPGDDAVCVYGGIWWNSDTNMDDIGPKQGDVCKILSVSADPNFGPCVELVGWPSDTFLASCFRKVQRRNDRLTIEAFMTMPGGFEEPRRRVEKPSKVRSPA